MYISLPPPVGYNAQTTRLLVNGYTRENSRERLLDVLLISALLTVRERAPMIMEKFLCDTRNNRDDYYAVFKKKK